MAGLGPNGRSISVVTQSVGCHHGNVILRAFCSVLSCLGIVSNLVAQVDDTLHGRAKLHPHC